MRKAELNGGQVLALVVGIGLAFALRSVFWPHVTGILVSGITGGAGAMMGLIGYEVYRRFRNSN